MKIGIIILCRSSSSRLPNKIFKEFDGASVLTHILLRLSNVIPLSEIIVATSDDISDDQIEQFCKRASLNCFRGSLYNVTERFLQCAVSHKLDYAVRINGDNVFIDGITLLEMLAIARTNCYDLITNVPARTFPYGMSIEIIKSKALSSFCNNSMKSHHAEHVTSYMYDNLGLFKTFVHKNLNYPNLQGLNLALDTYQDLERISQISSSINSHDLFTAKRISRLLYDTTTQIPWDIASPYLIAKIPFFSDISFDYFSKIVRTACHSDIRCIMPYTHSVENPSINLNKIDQSYDLNHKPLKTDQHLALAQICQSYSISYCPDILDLSSLKLLNKFLNFYKIEPGDFTAYPLLECMAAQGKPLLILAKFSSFDELFQVTNFFRSINSVYHQPHMICIVPGDFSESTYQSGTYNSLMQKYCNSLDCSYGYSDELDHSITTQQAISNGPSLFEIVFNNFSYQI